jgi:uncharacterized protein YndB with AHSA1/START domain
MSAAIKDSARKATLSTPTDRTIRTERVFDAPRDRVWRAFTDPSLLAQWWGRGNKVVIERFELERGGHWRFVEHSADGVHGFEGRFREITPPTRIVQTFEWDGMPGYVILSLFYSPEERDGMLSSGMEEGMNQSYGALDRLLETLD